MQTSKIGKNEPKTPPRPSPAVCWSFLSPFPPPVICCVYVSSDSYLSVHTHPSLEAHELLRIVSLKMDRAEEEMVLAVISHSGGTCLYETQTSLSTDGFFFLLALFNFHRRASQPFYIAALLTYFCSFFFSAFVTEERRLLQPSDCVYSESLTPQGKLVACRRDVTEILVR